MENITGSYNITQVAIGTMFSRIGKQEENFANSAYDQFLVNREILTGRVQDQYTGITLPSTGWMSNIPEGTKYDPNKHGRVNSNSADVLVPAFLAAYTGRDPNKVSLNPFMGILRILPNWSVTYDGLGRLPWMRDHFKSVTLTHAYTCKYAIGSFGSYSTWVEYRFRARCHHRRSAPECGLRHQYRHDHRGLQSAHRTEPDDEKLAERQTSIANNVT